MGELASSRIVAAALRGKRHAGRLGRCAQVLVTDAEHTAACRTWTRRAGATHELRGVATQRGDVPVLGGFIGATPTASRRRSAAAARTTRRRSSARASASTRSRSGPTSTACSPPIPRVVADAAARAAALVRRSVRAGLLRRQGAASEHDSAGGRQEHSGAHPQLAPAGSARAR